MSDTPCTEQDNQPHPGDIMADYKVEYIVTLSETEAFELAGDEGNEDEFQDDKIGTTEMNIQNHIEGIEEYPSSRWKVTLII